MDTHYYVGLSDVHLPIPAVDIGHGLSLEVTYGYLFAPYMMAFKRAPTGGHHPGPWRAVDAGFAKDITCQLVVPANATDDGFEEVVNKAWLIATLLRLRLSPHVRAVVISSSPISAETALDDSCRLWALEIYAAPLIQKMHSQLTVTTDEIEWLRLNWKRASKLIAGNSDFRILLEAYSACSWGRSAGLALVEVWGAVQRVFTQGHQEASLRLSSLLASYLERRGTARSELAKKIAKLYGARSQGAHGGQTDDLQPLVESMNLAARTISQLIEQEAVPTRDELFDMLYGP